MILLGFGFAGYNNERSELMLIPEAQETTKTAQSKHSWRPTHVEHPMLCALHYKVSYSIQCPRKHQEPYTTARFSRPVSSGSKGLQTNHDSTASLSAANIRRRHQAVSETTVRHLIRFCPTWHRSSGRRSLAVFNRAIPQNATEYSPRRARPSRSLLLLEFGHLHGSG